MSATDRLLSLFRRKAAAPPAPTTTKPVVTRAGGVFGSSKTSQPQVVNFDSLYYAVKHHSDTNAVMRYLMNTVGKAGYDFAATDGSEEPDPKAVELASSILESGPWSFRELIKATVLQIVATGNYYWLILKNADGKQLGLSQLHPQTTSIVVDIYGTVKAYTQRVPGAPPLIFPPEDVLHFIDLRDPQDDVYGMGRLQALIASELEADQKAARMNLKILDNDMKIPFIVRLPKDIGDADFERLSMWLRDSYAGWENSGRPLLAPGIEGIDTVTQTFSDMQFLELRRLSIDKVCSALGVPKSVLGYRDSANEASAGKVDRLTVYQDTIVPIEENIASKINKELFPRLGIEGIKFEFNYSSSVEAQLMEESTRKDVELGIRTINEARYERELDALDPLLYPYAAEPLVYTASGPIPLAELDLAPALPPAEQMAKALDLLKEPSIHTT